MSVTLSSDRFLNYKRKIMDLLKFKQSLSIPIHDQKITEKTLHANMLKVIHTLERAVTPSGTLR